MTPALQAYLFGMLVFNICFLVALLATKKQWDEWQTWIKDQRCAECKLRREDHATYGNRLLGHDFKREVNDDEAA